MLPVPVKGRRAALAVFAVLPLVTRLPLFFQVGALIAGVGLLVGLRPGRLERLASKPDTLRA